MASEAVSQPRAVHFLMQRHAMEKNPEAAFLKMDGYRFPLELNGRPVRTLRSILTDNDEVAGPRFKEASLELEG